MTAKEIVLRVLLGVAFLTAFRALGPTAWWAVGLALFIAFAIADVVARRPLRAKLVLFQAAVAFSLAGLLRLV